jgi:hypothetical protein
MKTERANIAPYSVLRAIRAVRIENRTIRSVAKNCGFSFSSPKAYCSRVSGNDIRGIPNNPTLLLSTRKIAR